MELINTIKTKLLITTFLFAPYFPVVAQEKLSDDDIIDRIPADMLVVLGGTFAMGATDGCGYDDERPIHNVTLTSFKISKYEVTQQLWNLIMDENPSTFQGDSLPVNNVSWDECQTFIEKLNKKTGKIFRLPTEAEWEFAARGGINGKDLGEGHGYQYAGGYNNIEDMDLYVWYKDNANQSTHKIGTKKPNELGLYDMSGNVCEYVQDFFSLTTYTEEAQWNPKGAEEGTSRVYRGGSYERPAWQVRLASRYGSDPSVRRIENGFRLAMDICEETSTWYLIADGFLKIPMSQVGMLVAADEEEVFSVLDRDGTVLAEGVRIAKFITENSESSNIENFKYYTTENILKSIVDNRLILVGAKGVIELFNIAGMKIKSVMATQEETVIDVSDLPTGIYAVRSGKLSFKFNKK